MNFIRLAEIVRKFDIDLLAHEIEILNENEDYQIETVDELADFLDDELGYAN